MVLQWPTLRGRGAGHVHELLDVDLARGQHPARVPDHRARARELAAVVAVQHRPARQHDRRDVDARPRPSSAPGWSCRSPWSAPRRRSGSRRAPRPATGIAGCGRASPSAACRSPGPDGPGTRAGCRPCRGCRRAPGSRARDGAGCRRQVRAGLGDADDRPARLQLLARQPEIEIALQIERRHVGLAVVVPPVLAAQPPLALIRHPRPRALPGRSGRGARC